MNITGFSTILTKSMTQILLAIIFLQMTILSCGRDIDTDNRLNIAETMMESNPDSALLILDYINADNLRLPEQRARHALLKSIALDKNQVDTTVFDILQPALDYYLKNGTSDERLKTLYYQGCIHFNAGQYDLAMRAWLTGSEVGNVSDSLTLARLLVAQGNLYHKQYRISDFIECNLRAAELYSVKNKSKMQLKCYGRALNGAVILNERLLADSIAILIRKIASDNSDLAGVVSSKYLNYLLEYGYEEEMIAALNDYEAGKINISGVGSLVLAKAYARLGKTREALYCIEETRIPSDNIHDSLTFLMIRSDIMERLGKPLYALYDMKRYTELLARTDYELFSNELLFSEKKHEAEINILLEKQKRTNVIWCAVSVVLLLLLAVILILYRYRLASSKRRIAEQEAEKLRSELESLEKERGRLSSLLEESPGLTPEMMKVVYQRLNMLNTLLAKELSSNDEYARPLIDSIHRDRQGFLASTRQAFTISNPRFMTFLKEHDLNEDEINYVCMYAMGLRGKEIGEYIQLKRHYVMGSGIRKKLGLDEHDTNLGPYIRKILNEL